MLEGCWLGSQDVVVSGESVVFQVDVQHQQVPDTSEGNEVEHEHDDKLGDVEIEEG